MDNVVIIVVVAATAVAVVITIGFTVFLITVLYSIVELLKKKVYNKPNIIIFLRIILKPIPLL